jgi:signal transduction histidine kinase
MNVFRIAPVITSQIEEIRNMWPERTISYAYCPDTAEVLGEQSQIKFAIFNLLDNARKYSPPDSVIELECHADAENIMIMIRNEGESVTPQEAESFFEKYHRGKHSVNTAGAGLGLWLVRNIIHQHQGEVAIRPTPTGVEAIVTLPVASRKI